MLVSSYEGCWPSVDSKNCRYRRKFLIGYSLFFGLCQIWRNVRYQECEHLNFTVKHIPIVILIPQLKHWL